MSCSSYLLRRWYHRRTCLPRFSSSLASPPTTVDQSIASRAAARFPDAVSSGPIASDLYSCNRLLCSVGRARGVADARALFDRMPQRDAATYSAMISLYIKDGNLPQAEALLRQSQHRNVVTESAMIDGYAKAGRVEDAHRIFDAMPARNVVSWTSLMSGYCLVGRVDEARRLFDQMPERNVVSWTTMMLGYSRNGFLMEARELFEKMPEKNVVAWTALVKAYVEDGRIHEARELFDRMPSRNVYSWNIMMSGYMDNDQATEAKILFCLMPYKNYVSWTTMVTGLARNGLIEEAREIFNRMPEKDIVASNAMITACCDAGHLSEARELFDSMPRRNAVTWNVMIDAYLKHGFQSEAWGFFILLHNSYMNWNAAIFTSVLHICDSNVEVKEIHGKAIMLGFDSDTLFVNALVTMYSRTGDLYSSWLAFEGLHHKDVVSWTSMILAYSNHGCGHYALQVFSHMLRHGAKPDDITFIGVLSACSHAGLVEKGKRIFEAMKRAYSLTPKPEHYSCLVDILGRAGLIKDAEAVVNEMPETARDQAVLGTLLAACRMHNKVDVAAQVGQELIELEPLGSASYVLLANVYASQGKWNDVARTRKIMKERKVKKVPGFSLIENAMKNHVFFAGDRSHPKANEIYKMLEEDLLPQMKKMECFQLIDTLPG